MMCTSQIVVSIDSIYKESIYFGIFSFNGGNIESLISSDHSGAPESFWGNFYGIKATLALFLIISVIYFVHHILSYTFSHSVNDDNRFIIEHQFVDINKTYYEYSVFPLLLFVIVTWIFEIFISASFGDVMDISAFPSPMLIILSVFAFMQFVINRIYTLE